MLNPATDVHDHKTCLCPQATEIPEDVFNKPVASFVLTVIELGFSNKVAGVVIPQESENKNSACGQITWVIGQFGQKIE